MKKLFALILAIMLVMAMSANAFATTIVGGDSGNVDVNIKNDDIINGTSEKVYYVSITWTNLTAFEFQFDAEYEELTLKWNPEKHDYVVEGTVNGNSVVATGRWLSNDKKVTVANHSNAVVNIKALFGTETSIVNNGVTATILNNVFPLEAAVEGSAFADAPSNFFTVRVENTPTNFEGYKVGTITVTVTP